MQTTASATIKDKKWENFLKLVEKIQIMRFNLFFKNLILLF